MTKQNRNILIGVGVLILLYLWWSSRQTKGARDIDPTLPPTQPPQHCTNSCCSPSGFPITPIKFPSCDCPQSDYVYTGGKNGSCVLSGIVGCMDSNATNFNPIATIPDANSCSYNQATRNCYSGCIGGNYNTINTQDACGTASATNYPHTSAPFCGQIPNVLTHSL